MARQYVATHRATGEQTVVNSRVDYEKSYAEVSRKAGYRYPADCDVAIVPVGQEYDLPFDEVPLIIRRANVAEVTAPAA